MKVRFDGLVRLWRASLGALSRFPLAVLSSFLMSVLAIDQVHEFSDFSSGFLILTLFFGIFVFVSFTSLGEGSSRVWVRWLYHLMGIVLVVGMGFYSYGIDESFPAWKSLNIFVFLFCSIVFVFLSGSLGFKGSGEDFRGRSFFIMHAFLKGFVYSFALLLCLEGIVFSIDKLFVFEFSHLYVDILIVVMIFIFSILFLSDFPRSGSLMILEKSRIVEVLLGMILVPCLWIYSGILYVYILKIALSWKLPEGIVAHLVLWYGFVSVVVMFLSEGLSEKIPMVSRFQKYFGYVLILPCILLFMSIGVRVHSYGLTLMRVLLVYGALFLLICVVYFCVLRRRDYRVLVIVAIILCISCAVGGPLSAFHLSFESQKGRLDAILRNHAEARHVESWGELGSEESKALGDILKYLHNDGLYVEGMSLGIEALGHGELLMDQLRVLNRYDYFRSVRLYFSDNQFDIEGFERIQTLTQRHFRTRELLLSEGDKSLKIPLDIIYKRVEKDDDLLDSSEKGVEDLSFYFYHDGKVFKIILRECWFAREKNGLRIDQVEGFVLSVGVPDWFGSILGMSKYSVLRKEHQ